jgi:peptide/nickel transport system substrate-binding protein
MAHRTALGLAAVATVLLLTGCPGGEGGPGGIDWTTVDDKDWGEPVPGGQMVARYIGDATAFNPIIAESTADSAVANQVFPYLSDSSWKDCETQAPPLLAHSWEWSDGRPGEEGGATLTYHLRDDVVWADGEPVTAEDVLFSYSLYSEPSVASPRYGYLEKIDSIDSPDPQTVVFRFTEIYPTETQLFHTGLGIVPKHILGEMAPGEVRSATDFNRRPVGAGAFQVTQWNPGSEIVIEPCENCTLRPRAFLDRVVIRIIPEETTALVALKKGNIDFMELSKLEPIEDIRANHPEIRIIKRGYRFLDYVAWNNKDPDAIKEARKDLAEHEALDLDAIPGHPLFGDREVRRALTMAIDRQSIMEAVTTVAGESYGRQATGTVTPELCKDYADITPLPFNQERAKEVLASRGWRDTNGDGTLDKDGMEFKFVLNYNSGNRRRFDACVYIQSMLKQIGVTVKIEPIESSVFFARMRQKDFHASLSGWSAALVIDPTDVWHSGAEHVFNFTSFSNPEVDRLIKAGLVEMDREKRRVIWKEMQRLIYEDQPYTFLYWHNGIALVHKRFQNVQSDILSAYNNLHEWWVPEELRKYKTR